ncbi:hypothetical protein G6F65_020988 [Rhizopus arrhizus]|nr:hypothetical protein G6F65_020988 [Rhizopus arrhizus]
MQATELCTLMIVEHAPRWRCRPILPAPACRKTPVAPSPGWRQRGIRGRGPSVRRWAPGVRPQSGAPFPECSAVLPSTTWSCLLDIRVRTGAGWALPALFCFARTWLAGAPRNREYTVRRAGSMRRVCADASARHASERSPGCPPGAPP